MGLLFGTMFNVQCPEGVQVKRIIRVQNRVLAAAVLVGLAGMAQAENRWLITDEEGMTPTPRLEDGTVDLGGNGVWNLPYITNMAQTLPGYDEGERPPFRPWAQAMWEYNR